MEQPTHPSDLDPGEALSRSSNSRWFTAANGLTSLRLVSAPLCACAILTGMAWAAGMLFALAIATDLADGRVARSRGEASPLGGLLDHSTDATFVSLGLAALAYQGLVPALLPVLVALAFLQYVYDSKSLAGHPLRASWLGRWNGIAYFVALGIPIVRDALGLGWPPNLLVLAVGWLLVASTLVSMVDRAQALLRLR